VKECSRVACACRDALIGESFNQVGRVSADSYEDVEEAGHWFGLFRSVTAETSLDFLAYALTSRDFQEQQIQLLGRLARWSSLGSEEPAGCPKTEPIVDRLPTDLVPQHPCCNLA
jgi:hypothetical protein